MSDEQLPPELPEPVLQPRRRLAPSLIWLVPAIAALAGLILVVRTIVSAGPSITITFKTAEGIEEGKTEVRYKNVVMGKVRSIKLTPDRQHVDVQVQLVKAASDLAVEDTRFWIVRPRVDLGGVSGLNTLLSGSYIGMDAGVSEESRRDFEGLEVPPAITHDQKGRRFLLHAEDLGSLNLGSPVYFRHLPVGRIVGFNLNADGKAVTLQAFIDDPYDQYVTQNVRFYNASGVSAQVGANGVQINMQSLLSLVAGGVVFELPPAMDGGGAVSGDTLFQLYDDRNMAMAPPDGPPLQIAMRFFQSVRGLAPNAPIDFRGLELGKVKTVVVDYDRGEHAFAGLVTAEIYPQRMGAAFRKYHKMEVGDSGRAEATFHDLIDKRSLRAQLRSSNLLTGALYVALDFMPNVKSLPPNPDARVLEIPTVAGSLDQIQTQIADIVKKLDDVPFGDIGNNLRDTLASANGLLKELDHDLAPEARRTLEEVRKTVDTLNQNLSTPDAPLAGDLHQTLQDVDRAAHAMKNLADYLQRHPESLVRGKPKGDEPEESK
ncbi:MAG TPA: MlaD family protein [Nevskiaceae bacterium]|nr:MlaD family protein [Nevskiaceae bacterium]